MFRDKEAAMRLLADGAFIFGTCCRASPYRAQQRAKSVQAWFHLHAYTYTLTLQVSTLISWRIFKLCGAHPHPQAGETDT